MSLGDLSRLLGGAIKQYNDNTNVLAAVANLAWLIHVSELVEITNSIRRDAFQKEFDTLPEVKAWRAEHVHVQQIRKDLLTELDGIYSVPSDFVLELGPIAIVLGAPPQNFSASPEAIAA